MNMNWKKHDVGNEHFWLGNGTTGDGRDVCCVWFNEIDGMYPEFNKIPDDKRDPVAKEVLGLKVC